MRKHIPPLTSLRFLAAMWVFVFHLYLWHGPIAFGTLDKMIHSGPVGMTFFFVLSGFILALASEGTNPLTDFRGYAVRRFARIYPIYLFILVSGWLLNGFAGDDLGEKPLRSAAAHGIADLTLTNAWFPQLFHGGHGRDGTWSLSAEMFFYALFPLILYHARELSDRALTLGIRWAIGLTVFFSLLGKYIQPDPVAGFAVFYSIPIFRLPEFVAGVFAGVLAMRTTITPPTGRQLGWGFLGIVAYFAIFAKSLPFVAHGLFAIPFLLMAFTYFALTSEGRVVRIFAHPAFVFLGEASFALYLVQLVTIPWFKANAMGLGLRPAIALCFVVTLALACLVHVAIERPMRPLVSRWLASKPVA